MSEHVGLGRIALVIANSTYLHARPLRNTKADAVGIASALAAAGFTSHRSGILKPYYDQSLMDMNRLLADFSVGADNAEMAVIYYSGHGIEIDFRNFLIPVDAELVHVARVDYEALPLPAVINAALGTSKLSLTIL